MGAPRRFDVSELKRLNSTGKSDQALVVSTLGIQSSPRDLDLLHLILATPELILRKPPPKKNWNAISKGQKKKFHSSFVTQLLNRYPSIDNDEFKSSYFIKFSIRDLFSFESMRLFSDRSLLAARADLADQ